MDCGPACIRMIASAYGRNYPLSYLRTLSHLTREGVSVTGIRSALKEIGIESATFELTTEQLHKDCPMPSILYWEQNHFVVLYNVTKKYWGEGYVFHVANPAFGKQKLSEQDFCGHWLNGKKGIVIACEPTEDFFVKKQIIERHSLLSFAHKFVWPYRWEMFQTALGMFFGMAISMTTPFLTQAMVDEGIGLRDMGVIVNIMIAQVSIFLGSFLMSIIGSWVGLYMGTRINIDILKNYLGKLLKLPMSFFETKSIGDYQQRLGDNGRLQGFVTYNTLQTIFSLLSVPVLMSIIGFYSLKILMAYIAFTTACTIWMIYFFRRRKSLDYERFRINAQNQNKTFEMMSGIVDIKVNVIEDNKLNEWHELQEEVYAISKKSLKLEQAQNTGYTLIGQLRNIIITFWIASEVVDGALSLGMMMSISTIIGQINSPLSQLIGFLQRYQDAKTSLERAEEVQLCKAEDDGDMQDIGEECPCEIKIENLSFSYNGNVGEKAINNINLTLPAGKTTAIVGESGSGKTTLLKILLKFYEPTSGKIIIGNKDLKNITARSVRKLSGVIMQDSYIFAESLKANIILGSKPDDNRINEVIKTACLDQFVKDHPLT